MAAEANDVATLALSQLGMMECPIANLADEDLAAIFKHLPPYERLIVSEVCGKLRDISQTPWRDVTRLDLSHVPTLHIHAVIRKCPNLSSVSGLRQSLGSFCRFIARLSNLVSLACAECDFTIERESLPGEAAAILAGVAWQELIWHNCSVRLMEGNAVSDRFLMPIELPSSPQRLQLVVFNGAVGIDRIYNTGNVFRHNSNTLDCLILAGTHTCQDEAWVSLSCPSLWYNYSSLRELFLDEPHTVCLSKLAFALRKLDVLFLNDVMFEWAPLQRLMTQHRSLRVLVITTSRTSNFAGAITIPVRKLFPNGFNAPAVPRLHLFLGKTAADRLRFHPSPTDALRIYPIDAPLPDFLEKEEIKPIFEGSWIASRIKEGAKEGVNLANYSFEGNAESISYVQE